MIQILRDTVWTFIFGILGIGLAVYFYLRQRQRKSLSYQVLAKTPLVTVNESVTDRFQITYDGKPILEPYLVLLKITNDGNTPITSADFESPVSFSFGGETSILSIEITDSFPKTLRPKLETPPKVNMQPTRLEIGPVLWNSGDFITIKLLLSQLYSGVIECNARIVGVREVKDSTDRTTIYTSWPYQQMIFAGFASLFMGLFLLELASAPQFGKTILLVASLFLLLVGFLSIVVVLIIAARKTIRSWKSIPSPKF